MHKIWWEQEGLDFASLREEGNRGANERGKGKGHRSRKII